MLFVHHDPVTWDGLIGSDVPQSGFTAWLIGITYAVIKALNRQVAEGSEPG